MAKGKAGSFKPSDAVTGGGLVNDFDGTVNKGRFTEFQYVSKDGTKGNTTNVFQLSIEPEDGDEFKENYTIGTGWEIEDEGMRVTGNSGFNDSTKFMQFIASLVKCGYPEEKLTDNADQFDGMVAHFLRMPGPDRPGLESRKRKEMILCVTHIEKYPWDKKGKGSGAGKGKKDEKEAPPVDDEINDRAELEVMRLLDDNPKGMKIKDLRNEVYAVLKKDKSLDQKTNVAIMKLVYDPDWHEGKPWEFDAKKEMVGG